MHLMGHNLRKHARPVPWVTTVKTAARSPTERLFVQKAITARWEQNSPPSSPALRAHTTQMLTRQQDQLLVYLALKATTAKLAHVNQLCVHLDTIVPVALAQGRNLLVTLDFTMISLGLRTTLSVRRALLGRIAPMVH